VSGCWFGLATSSKVSTHREILAPVVPVHANGKFHREGGLIHGTLRAQLNDGHARAPSKR